MFYNKCTATFAFCTVGWVLLLCNATPRQIFSLNRGYCLCSYGCSKLARGCAEACMFERAAMLCDCMYHLLVRARPSSACGIAAQFGSLHSNCRIYITLTGQPVHAEQRSECSNFERVSAGAEKLPRPNDMHEQ